MKIIITKKCFVGNTLRYEGEILDVEDASAYDGVAKVIGEEKKAEEPKPAKTVPKKKGTKK